MENLVSEHIFQRLSELPLLPGVYLMKNSRGKIIYIGKAKVLKNRVRSYFDGREHTGHRAASLMLPHIHDIEWIITESEREALILEANLVRKHTPIYNVRLKDDKHFPYIKVDMHEPFPRLEVTRSVKNDGAMYFGPYMGTRVIRHLVDLSARLFKIRECSLKLPLANKGKLCLNYHIGRCLGPCANLCDVSEYKENTRKALQLLSGKRDDLIALYEQEMQEASEKFDFETAAKKRDIIFALQTTVAKQKADSADVSLKMDVLAVRRHEKKAVAVILEYRAGVFYGRRHFRLECNLEDDEAEICRQMIPIWYAEETEIPPEIALERELGESGVLLEEMLSERAGRKVNLFMPQRGEKLGFMKLAIANAEMLLVEMAAESKKYDDIEKGVFELQKILELPKAPFRIECADISHLSGSNTVASVVTFKNGRPDKKNYRKFIIKTVEGIDDFASMQEVMSRRLRRLEEEGLELPDLWVCDGGKGQVEATYSILKKLGYEHLPLIGLAKRLEEIVFPGDKPSVILKRTNPALKLLQNARDEAHRFAITYQRSKRKSSLEVKWLDVEGVGRETRIKILSKYRSAEDFLSAPLEDLEQLLGKVRSQKIRAAVQKVVEEE